MEVNVTQKRKAGFNIFVFILGSILMFGFLRAREFAVLKGRITDTRGRAVVGAVLKLEHGQSGKIYRTTTDENGFYEFLKIPTGSYSLTAECPGYASIRINKIVLKSTVFHLRLKRVLPETKQDEGKIKKETTGGVLGGVVGGVRRSAAAPAEILSPPPSVYSDFNTEEYSRIYENGYAAAAGHPLSTFSIDVDTASYANVRRFLYSNRFPPKDAVRIEELVNYFDYDYPQPEGGDPFSITTEMSFCPWNKNHHLALIGLKGKELDREKRPAGNLVFLIDVSGSMGSPNKLPLLKSAFRLLTDQLTEKDRVTIVVYAGAAGMVLSPTPGSSKRKIFQALDRLEAGGSTAGGAGIQLAYKTAHQNYIKEGNNRIILATDGDFNVGVSGTSELVRIVEAERERGIFLTVLGFGMGNYKDSRLEQIADKGNGQFFYIDSLMEAKKVFVDDLRGTLFTIAKDVKVQVEFNPAKVKAYRLVGYENRMLKNEDFADDTKDAGELGAGHTVTALYEIIPFGSKEKILSAGELKYQENRIKPDAFTSKEIFTVKLRYKKPDGKKSRLLAETLEEKDFSFEETSTYLSFAAAAASFGLLLRDSKFKGEASFEKVLNLARRGQGRDRFGYRAEFIRLVELCSLLEAEVRR